MSNLEHMVSRSSGKREESKDLHEEDLHQHQDTLPRPSLLLSSQHRSVEKDDKMTGEKVAKLFKFYRLQQNPHITHPVPLKLVPSKTIYREHKDKFDAFAKIADENHFDVDRYMKYCVSCGINEKNVEACLSSTTMIDKFELHVEKVNNRKKMYRWFMDTVAYIAEECATEGYFTTKDFLRMLIDTKQLAGYVVSGKISMYWLAAIPKFDAAIDKLDYFARIELQSLKEHFDIYHSEINKAFLQEKHKMVNPIALTDKAIADARQCKLSHRR